MDEHADTIDGYSDDSEPPFYSDQSDVDEEMYESDAVSDNGRGHSSGHSSSHIAHAHVHSRISMSEQATSDAAYFKPVPDHDRHTSTPPPPAQSPESQAPVTQAWPSSYMHTVDDEPEVVVEMTTGSPPPPPPPPTHASRHMALVRSAVRVCTGVCNGLCVICSTMCESMRDAVLSSSFYPRKAEAGWAAATARLQLIILIEVIILTLQLTLMIVVGLDNEVARLVHIQFLWVQCVSVVSVPLGVWVYIFEGLSGNPSGAEHVYTLYTVCESLRLFGDVFNLVRFARAFDDLRHVIAIIAPDLVVLEDDWDHGVCGRTHAIAILLNVSCVVGAICSLMNVISLLVQSGVVTGGMGEKDHGDSESESRGRARVPDYDPPRAGDVRLRSSRTKNSSYHRTTAYGNNVQRQPPDQRTHEQKLAEQREFMSGVFTDS